MLATKRKRYPLSQNNRGRHYGGVAVEFALVVGVFFTFVFGALELARAMYVINTLQEVTRRAASMAANSRFDAATLDTIRSEALFRDSAGNLLLGKPIGPSHLKIEYLSLVRDEDDGPLSLQPVSPMPSCPARNRLNCFANPNATNCIRMIRVQVCQPDSGDDCTPVPYEMMFPFVDLSSLSLPRAQAMVPAQTLGYTSGSIPCP